MLIDKVAARAHVRKGTLYHYFPTKEDLYVATIFDGGDRLREELEEVLQEEGLPLEDALEKPRVRHCRIFGSVANSSRSSTAWSKSPTGMNRTSSAPDVKASSDSLTEKRGLGPNTLSAGHCRLLTEMFFGMLRSVILYRRQRATPEALAASVVRLFLDSFHAYVELKDTRTSRTSTGGKPDGRATTLLS